MVRPLLPALNYIKSSTMAKKAGPSKPSSSSIQTTEVAGRIYNPNISSITC